MMMMMSFVILASGQSDAQPTDVSGCQNLQMTA